MIRILGYDLFLFLLPFAVFAVWIALGRKNPFRRDAWQDAPTFWLIVIALVMAIVGLLGLAQFGGSETGVYVPPRYENGTVVPGHFIPEPVP